MIFDWYLIFNLAEFEALNLVSKTYSAIYEDLGEKDILVTKGAYVAIQYEGVFLPIMMSDKNPFAFDGFAVYWNEETDNVYLGIEVEQDEN